MKMRRTEKEQWWDKLDTTQRKTLLRTAGASAAQIEVFRFREWFQLSRWIKHAICRLKPHQMAVPLPKAPRAA